MEFENLDEKVKQEAKRVAAAFEVMEWNIKPLQKMTVFLYFRGVSNTGELVEWCLSNPWAELQHVSTWLNGQILDSCIRNFGDTWQPNSTYHQCNQLIARALYRLGVEDETMLAELPTLSAHEKLELHLSMPREFWPQKWIDEEAANC